MKLENKVVVRTDRHNNPTAMITDLAKQGGLREGVDYISGDSFTGPDGRKYATAQFIGSPIKMTTRVIDSVGFFTLTGRPRWSYVIPLVKFMWTLLTEDQRRQVVGYMYHREGGSEMKGLFVDA